MIAIRALRLDHFSITCSAENISEAGASFVCMQSKDTGCLRNEKNTAVENILERA